jgi:hypothetical protein
MDQPIACTLSTDQYTGRTRELAALTAHALRGREPLPGGARLHFAADAETEQELRQLVAAEAQCCAFLRMDVRRTDDTLILEITGPAEAESIIGELFA